ncbi:MAG: transglycosylase SLT domain-containing protein [Patescibacteria group bacterium]
MTEILSSAAPEGPPENPLEGEIPAEIIGEGSKLESRVKLAELEGDVSGMEASIGSLNLPKTPQTATPSAAEPTLWKKLKSSLGAAAKWFTDHTGSLGRWLTKTFGAEEELPHYRTDDESYDPDDPETKKLVGSAEKQLNSALEKNPSWLGLAQEAAKRSTIAVPILFAFARFESAFNPNAVNGTVAGLGQFWGPTWDRFMAENPDFKGASRTDPRASFCAMAWYARKNAEECKIDTSAPDAAARLYEAHHEGAGGFAQLQAFRRGEITGKQRIPKTYAGKSFPKFGVPIVDTYENYVKLVTAMSAKVQAVADLYNTVLPAYSSQQTNS